MFTEADRRLFEEKNISIEKINHQIKNFVNGFPFVNLGAAATPGNGILVLTEDEIKDSMEYFENHFKKYKIVKMVPASGAASRMFKNLFTYMDGKDTTASKDVVEFIERIEDFAFYPALKRSLLNDDYNIDHLLADGDFKTIISYLLEEKGLGYASLPKGLLDFHRYEEDARTPLEEHLMEGLEYSTDKDGITHVHFTVSPEHKEKFIKKAAEAINSSTKLKQGHFEISWSVQKPSTDTIAVDPNNNPFRNPDGSILFRPGGHGALIENLNDLDTDIAFIKNIDNVVPDKLKAPTYIYKKVIGGILMKLSHEVKEILEKLNNKLVDEKELDRYLDFASRKLNLDVTSRINGYSIDKRRKMLFDMLNRPLRVCGMVKNEGEPGGGPFLVKDKNGNKSLQIVETSQIDLYNEGQKKILQQATHFNPVDLVCKLKDYKGHRFDLHKFVDPETGFISQKSKDGKDLKAQELPGLWNGAMAHWITIFIEVPIDTFNPVKTVNDLLRPQHQ
jgi:hypothetical protein